MAGQWAPTRPVRDQRKAPTNPSPSNIAELPLCHKGIVLAIHVPMYQMYRNNSPDSQIRSISTSFAATLCFERI